MDRATITDEQDSVALLASAIRAIVEDPALLADVRRGLLTFDGSPESVRRGLLRIAGALERYQKEGEREGVLV